MTDTKTATRSKKTGTITLPGTKSVKGAPIVSRTPDGRVSLKQIIDDIFKDTKVSLDPKRVRAKLRVKYRGEHHHMANWTFDKAQYDEVRSMYDPQYKAKIEGTAKPKKTRTPKAKVIKEPEVTPAPIELVKDGEPQF